MVKNFDKIKRQNHISEESYLNTRRHYIGEEKQLAQNLREPALVPGDYSSTYYLRLISRFENFQLQYTGGEPIEDLSKYLGLIVDALEDCIERGEKAPDMEYISPLLIDDQIDAYVLYLSLLSAAVLLHREELIPRIFSLIEGGEYDERDAVIEELLKFYLPDRPSLDNWIWDQPYRKLLDSIDEADPVEQAKLMKKYVTSWYKSMKGKADFWGAHEKVTPELSPYNGYWAMCAGAFTYLYGIDDSAYRNELVYPKDLVDYARSMPRKAVISENAGEVLRVVGGDRCPRTGVWLTPADEKSARHFSLDELMPSINVSDYGATIWQWRSE